jgi:TolB-like protein
VLPLDNLSGDGNQENFADGMTDELITMLAKDSSLRVTSRTSVMQYKGAHRPLRDIARALNVDAILEGSVARSSSKVHLSLQLIRTDTDTHVWADSYDRNVTDAHELPDEAARAIANSLHRPVASASRARPVNSEAHDDYLHGKYLINRNTEPDMQTSIGYFKRSIAKDPGYALAYAGLSEAYGRLTASPWIPVYPKEMLAQQKAAALKSVELDPSLPEGHLQLASALAQEWNWLDAEKEVRQAITLSPNYADAYHMYSQLLSVVGRSDEAFSQINYAIELDPLNSDYKHELGWTAFRARRYDLAEHQFKSLEDGFGLAAVYVGRKMYPEVIAAMQGSIDRDGRKPIYISVQAWAYGSAGNKPYRTKAAVLKFASFVIEASLPLRR